MHISLYKPGSGAGALRNLLGPVADHGVSEEKGPPKSSPSGPRGTIARYMKI